MSPDYELAATAAIRTLLFHNITAAPIVPLPIVKSTPGVLAMPFSDLASHAGIERNKLVPMFSENQDAVTFFVNLEKVKYVVAYNQYLPFDSIRRGLARELGHIVLGHDGSRPADIRLEEAMCFARHLIFPRPLIHSIQNAGFPLTVEVLGNITGCYERCLAGLQKTPGVHVPSELNRALKERFTGFIQNYVDFQSMISAGDNTAVADFGSFMDGYEE